MKVDNTVPEELKSKVSKWSNQALKQALSKVSEEVKVSSDKFSGKVLEARTDTSLHDVYIVIDVEIVAPKDAVIRPELGTTFDFAVVLSVAAFVNMQTFVSEFTRMFTGTFLPYTVKYA